MKNENQVTSADFSPDGKRVIEAFGERIWDAETGRGDQCAEVALWPGYFR